MLATLIEEYTQKRRIYLSWDAALWHMSKMLYAHVAEHNDAVANGEVVGPLVALAPLPAGAQFLNVIESVFSGTARAIIANSNYGSVDKARAAIERYVKEREVQVYAEARRRQNMGNGTRTSTILRNRITLRTHATVVDLRPANARRLLDSKDLQVEAFRP
jgi:hypothetical protein